MQDIIQKHGGWTLFKRHMASLYERVCDDKKIKHYFFGVKQEHVVNDQVSFQSFVLPKPNHLYLETPDQHAIAAIRVKPAVMDDVFQAVQREMQLMGVNWRDLARSAHYIMRITEETRARSADTENSFLERDQVNEANLDKLLKKKYVNSKVQENNEIFLNKGGAITYPFWLVLDTPARKLRFVARGYGREGIDVAHVQAVMDKALARYDFMPLVLRKDAQGDHIYCEFTMDYAAMGIPIRMLLSSIKEFSQRFDEVMVLDKDERLINLVRDF